MNILITTFGTSWAIVPELLGFTNTELLDLYKNHPNIKELINEKEKYGITSIDELWLITTDENRFDKIYEWLKFLENKIKIKIFISAKINDLTNLENCKRFGDLIFRIVLMAKEQTIENGKLFLSLTGGRKTMSADMQKAAFYFGCDALLHIIDNGNIPPELRNPDIEIFQRPLEKNIAGTFTPVILGKYYQNPIVTDIINSNNYKINTIKIEGDKRWIETDTLLYGELEKRINDAYNFIINYSEETDNFRILYTLPEETIKRIKSQFLGIDLSKKEVELNLLKKLPKSELHCHLGGAFSCEDLIEIAKENEEEIEKYKTIFENDFNKIINYINISDIDRIQEICNDENFFKKLRTKYSGIPEPYAILSFILLFENNHEILEKIIYKEYIDQEKFRSIGIENYERIGDIQGSGLLQNEKIIRKSVNVLIKKVIEENITYLEIRCSPINYTRGGLDAKQVVKFIIDEVKKYSDRIVVKILFIASRHNKLSDLVRHIELYDELKNDYDFNKYFAGFDLAGNEEKKRPGAVRELFLPLLNDCINITIHAGETASVENIWEAVYYLNAERIGHGLTLKDNENLIKKFRNRKIGVEMCPSSNFQIVGFRDNFIKETFDKKEYPIKKYLDYGLKVSVNTDNMGISRTTQSNELYKAARMTKEGLSLWDILKIIYNGYKTAFVDIDCKKRLILDAEHKIIKVLKEEKII